MRMIPTLAAAAAILMLTACEDKGPAEQAGEEIDEAMESVQDDTRDLGNEIDDAVDDMQDNAEDAAEEIKDGVDDAADEVSSH